MDHIDKALSNCGYPQWVQKRAKNSVSSKSAKQKDSNQRVVLPFVNSIASCLKRAFYNKGVDLAFKSPNTLRNKLVHPKDKSDKGDKTGIMYKIPCNDCEDTYIGETGRSLKDRLKEHKRAFRLNYPTQSAVAEHAIDTGHNIGWENAHIIDSESHFWPRKVKEAIWIRKTNPSLNRDSGYTLSPDLFMPQ